MRRKNFFVILLIFFAIILLAQVFVMARGLWFDDSYSILFAKQSANEIIKPTDVHPFGYYLVLHFWIKIFGDGIPMLRILSVIFGLASFCMLYLIWNKLFERQKIFRDPNSFLICGVMFILASTFVFYCTEIRMYAMGLFFCLVSFYALLNFEKKWLKLLFVGSTAILPFIHYFTVFFVMFELSYCLMKKKKETIKYWFASFIIMIPAVLYFFSQLARIETLGFQKSSFSSVLSTYYYAWFYSWGGAVSKIDTIFGLMFIALAFFLIVKYLGERVVSDEEKKVSLLMLIWFVLPTVIMMMINEFIMNLYHHRFFFFVAWFFVFLTARAIYILKDEAWVKVIAALMMLFMVANMISFEMGTDNDVKVISGFLNKKACSDTNIIIHETQFSNLPHVYYNEVHGCYKNYLVTDLNRKQLNAIGVNVVPSGRILQSVRDLEQFDKFYYVLGAGQIYSDKFDYIAYEYNGIKILLAQKKNVKTVSALRTYSEEDYLISLNGTCRRASDCFMNTSLKGCSKADCNWCCNTPGMLAGCTLMWCGDEGIKV
jgi:uncharacterized membrane protein